MDVETVCHSHKAAIVIVNDYIDRC